MALNWFGPVSCTVRRNQRELQLRSSRCRKQQCGGFCESVWCFLVINVCNHGEHYETPCIMNSVRSLSYIFGYCSLTRNCWRGTLFFTRFPATFFSMSHKILCKIITNEGGLLKSLHFSHTLSTFSLLLLSIIERPSDVPAPLRGESGRRLPCVSHHRIFLARRED
jgi:hypothetical protein